jgi:hypothetical protein
VLKFHHSTSLRETPGIFARVLWQSHFSLVGYPSSIIIRLSRKLQAYNIKAPGNYKMIIGEYMMDGESLVEDFKLKAWVK